MRRIGVDVGGTFTDLIYIDDEAGEVIVHKTPSTPADPSIGTVQGISELCAMAGIEPAQLDQVFHGTTVATNIVIEHTGAKVGMITSKGYRDILHIARHKKPMNFSLWQNLPWQAQPIVRRRFRLTVNERIDKDGNILIPLDDDEVRAQVRRLKQEQVEAVSVCLLFSFLNPEHEQRVASIVREEFPEAFLSVSSEVIPQYREYERFSTVGLNAYVGPKVSSYIGRFDAALRKMNVKSGVHLMTSAAGVATPAGAMQKPVNLLMSGPIAGVVGGIWTGRQSKETNVITLDVGGTSADIGLAQDGKLRMKHLLDTKVGPYQAMIPMVDVDTIGAGGGSIAYIDAGGIFRVGPRSAGADPGPVAYGRGGTEPTATDAMVVLGWLRPELFLGGKMELREDLAREAIDTHLASKLGTSIEDAAMGVYRILVHSMVDAIEQASVRKGFDPREFVLVAEGGGGPLFAPEIAPEVGVKNVLVPSYPGITAALGLLTTDMVYEYVATSYAMASALYSDGAACKTLEGQFAKLQADARAQFESDGIDPKRVRLENIAEARYEGQGYELRIDVGSGPVDAGWIDAMKATFHDIHEREYSRRFEDADVQIANVRVRAVGLMPGLDAPQVERGKTAPPKGALKLTADAWFRQKSKLKKLETAFYERTELLAGNVVDGPAIITQFDSTTVVPPGFSCKVDRVGNLVITYSKAVQQAAERGH
ncbi:MAG: hydantoinase/oxoprolinase family protein [Actinomycetota bacterium]|nr:hydantoinase/oxoprolinase family protein [Actinomycetota bacterium]